MIRFTQKMADEMLYMNYFSQWSFFAEVLESVNVRRCCVENNLFTSVCHFTDILFHGHLLLMCMLLRQDSRSTLVCSLPEVSYTAAV